MPLAPLLSTGSCYPFLLRTPQNSLTLEAPQVLELLFFLVPHGLGSSGKPRQFSIPMLAAAPRTLAYMATIPVTLQPWGRLLGAEELQKDRYLEKTGDQGPQVVGATLCLQVAPSLLRAALRAAGHGTMASEPIFLTQQVASLPSSPAQTNQFHVWPSFHCDGVTLGMRPLCLDYIKCQFLGCLCTYGSDGRGCGGGCRTVGSSAGCPGPTAH